MTRRFIPAIKEVLREIELGEADFCQDMMAEKDQFCSRVHGEQNQHDLIDMKVIIPLKPETELLTTTEMRYAMLKQFKRRYHNNIRERRLKTFIQSEGPMRISLYIHRLLKESQLVKDIVKAKFYCEAAITRMTIDLRNKPQNAEQILANIALHKGYLAELDRDFRAVCNDMKWFQLTVDHLEINLDIARRKLRK